MVVGGSQKEGLAGINAAIEITAIAFGDCRLPVKFWRHVAELQSGCWSWVGARQHNGYGRVAVGYTTRPAHRVAYETLVGEIPAGLELDHLCRDPSCINPAHLEPVTHGVNVLRGHNPSALNAKKEFCKRGHLFDEENTYWWRGTRQCNVCRRLHSRILVDRRRLRRRAAKAEAKKKVLA